MGKAIIKFSRSFLVRPETLRDYEAILPGSAERILDLAEREQMHRARLKRWIRVCGFVLVLALTALSAYFVSLGFAWEAVVVLCAGIAGAALIVINEYLRLPLV